MHGYLYSIFLSSAGQKPTNVVIEAQGQKRILVTWNAPVPPLGIIKAFHFTVNGSPSPKTAKPTDTSRELSDLKPFTDYTIGIATENYAPTGVSGLGEFVEKSVKTWPNRMFKGQG